MFVFPNLPIEISVVIDEFVQEQLQYELEIEKKEKMKLVEAILSGLIIYSVWKNWKNQPIAEKLESELKEKYANTPEVAVHTIEIDETIQKHQGYYYNTDSKKVHVSLDCAFKKPEHKRYARIYDAYQIESLEKCGNCMKQ